MNSIKKISKLCSIIITFLMLFISSLSGVAQNRCMVVGQILVENGSIENTHITIFEGAKELGRARVDSDGGFRFELDFGRKFILRFSKDGFVTKKVSVSTYIPDKILDAGNQVWTCELTVSIFPISEEMDISVFDKPMGLIRYNRITNNFKYDEEYDAKIRREVERALAEAKRKLAEKQILKKEYDAAITLADKHMNEQKYSEAKTAYQEALRLMPNEKLPKEKLKEINLLIGEKQNYTTIDEEKNFIENNNSTNPKIEKQYREFIKYADESLENKQIGVSRFYYGKALELKPEEAYPKKQLENVKTLILSSKEERLFSEYSQNVNSGNEAFEKQNFFIAKHYYREAFKIYPKYDYPNRQIEKINKLLKEREKTKLKNDYLKTIEKADNDFKNKKPSATVGVSKFYYKKAVELKQEEKYPKKQLESIEAVVLLSKEEQFFEEYSQNVDLANEAFEKQNFSIAKYYYKKAFNTYPKYDYPNEQIEQIDKLLKEREKAKLKNEYLELIKKADENFNNENLSGARFYYIKATELMPNEKYPLEKLEIIAKKIKAE